MSRARILLAMAALFSFVAVLYFFLHGSQPAPVIEQAAAPQSPAAQVLIAKQPIGVGERLTSAMVDWQSWPENAVRPEFITIAKSPDAATRIAGSVARFEIFPGEPVLDAKLAHSDQGFLSAVLQPGMRGVSIQVSAVSGSGGFILPNDRVDVIVTDDSSGTTNSRVVLSDVKVLAIGTRLGQTGATGAPPDPADPKSQVFTNDVITTLELTPQQGETLMNATAAGKVTLFLRSVADFNRPIVADADDSVGNKDDVAVKIVRFGRATTVTPGSSNQGQSSLGASNAASAMVAAAQAPMVTTTTGPAAVAADGVAAAAATQPSGSNTPAPAAGGTDAAAPTTTTTVINGTTTPAPVPPPIAPVQ